MIVLLHFRTSGIITNLPVVLNGYLFVDFFFVLSGFVIQANYAHRVGTGSEFGKFLIKRFGRLYPLHIFMLLSLVALEFAQSLPMLNQMGASEPFEGEARSGYAFVTNLFLVHGLGMHDAVTWNSVSWSISTEFWAYVAFAVATFIFRQKTVIVAALVCVAAPVFLGVFSELNMHTTYEYGYIRCIFGFAAGMLTYDIHNRFFRNVSFGSITATMLEVATVGLIIGYISIVGHSLASLAAPFIFMFGILVFAAEKGAASKVLQHKWLLLIGTLSYSIYMVHMIIQTFWKIGALIIGKVFDYPLLQLVPVLHGNGVERSFGQSVWQGDLGTVLMLLSVILVSYFTYYWIEDPFRKMFNRWANKIKTPSRTDQHAASIKP